jgi:SAM-dependent methyltransferase
MGRHEGRLIQPNGATSMTLTLQHVQNELMRLQTSSRDAAAGRFFWFLSQSLESNDSLRETFNTIISERPSVNGNHLAWLLFAALQSVSSFAYDGVEKWEYVEFSKQLEIDLLCGRARIVQACSTQNVSTHIIGRYAALQMIAVLLCSQKPLNILDVGCSLGLGLLSLNTDYLKALAEVTDPLLASALAQRVKLGDRVGIDSCTPDFDWLSACYFPIHKNCRAVARAVYEDLNLPDRRCRLIKMDASNIDNTSIIVPGSYFDIVWMSNSHYQFEGAERQIIQNIRNALTPGGVLLNAYFPLCRPGFIVASGKNPRDRPLKILETREDHVVVLSQGPDLNEFLKVRASVSCNDNCTTDSGTVLKEDRFD